MISKIFNCISIHNGGGLVYLSMIHSKLDKKGNLILLDHRAKKHIKPFSNAKIKFFKKSPYRNFLVFKERLKNNQIFKKNIKNLNKKIYFHEYYLSGIPPLIRFPISQNKVFVLFQNRNLFSYLNYFNDNLFFKFNFIVYHILHFLLINIFLKDSDTIIVQTSSMRNKISRIKPKNRIIVEKNYWENCDFNAINFSSKKLNRKKGILLKIRNAAKTNNLFFYPASLEPHKNHKILLKSFIKLNDFSTKNFKVVLTINPSDLPNNFRNNDFIIFIGNQPLEIIHEIYKLVDFLIFPSLNESLGLPLLEASFYKLPIIASDLEFVYDVCKPKYTFDPYSSEDIYNKILISLN